MAGETGGATRKVGLDDVMHDEEIRTYILTSDRYLGAIGFTEHGLRHVGLVSRNARRILLELGHPEREAELAGIAGYLHDIGNMVSRDHHGQTGAVIAWNLLRRMGMDPEETARVVAAIGNHEEEYGNSVNVTAAALVIADKADAHYKRVRNREVATFDIHDRVNYAVRDAVVDVDAANRRIDLRLEIDTAIASVAEYFEIFLVRMMMSRRAANFLDCEFALNINDRRVL